MTPAASSRPFVYATASAWMALARDAVTASRVGSHPRCRASHRTIVIPMTVESVSRSAVDHSSGSSRDDEENDSPRKVARVSKPSELLARRSVSR